MKRIILPFVVAAAVVVSAFTLAGSENAVITEATTASLAIQNYKVVPAESKITWIGRKVTGEHTGTIQLKEGTILFDRTVLRGGSFFMDMNSITCTDLKDPKSNGNLVKHLRSDDFFSVEKNPTAMFAISNLATRPNAKSGTANYIITGNLTIKGISHEISFPMLVNVRKGVATAKGTLKFDRTKWDIKYRSGNFFENLGDRAIEDDVELQMEIVAKVEEVAKDKKKKDAKEKTAKL
ncbi:YceI family protein [Rufibacter roseus]|uniref:YceI family protein n=1 Tax=Rufibacter roseus TaxID=1567108 RepID=A0ABW2DKR6_9BACT|nr:YceI family protein [Rufibacter roseus]